MLLLRTISILKFIYIDMKLRQHNIAAIDRTLTSNPATEGGVPSAAARRGSLQPQCCRSFMSDRSPSAAVFITESRY
jgi:hypothetical protein